MPLTVGTAGHIDHGKTWLVRALTGKDTDRLPEEKERGISIDLGYAPLDLPDGTRLSLIDVPGHERFIRNMVAGASGIDLFLLVIDATEGARPQTHEHLAILRLLGIDDGVVAVTKADAADAETLELVMDEARELVPGAAVVAVSAKTGEGLDELRTALVSAAGASEHHALLGATRLYVDRAFTLHGIGTVVTGTLWSGSVGEGDELRAEPAGVDVRVRSVQVHDEPVERAEAGQRVALALPGIERTALATGRRARRAGRLSRQLPPRRRARGARADRRPHAGARASRDDGNPRPGRTSRGALRAAAARRSGGRGAQRPHRPPQRDDARRRPHPRSGSPTRARSRPPRAARDGRSGLDREGARARACPHPRALGPRAALTRAARARASNRSGIQASGTSHPIGSSRSSAR